MIKICKRVYSEDGPIQLPSTLMKSIKEFFLHPYNRMLINEWKKEVNFMSLFERWENYLKRIKQYNPLSNLELGLFLLEAGIYFIDYYPVTTINRIIKDFTTILIKNKITISRER